MNTNAVIALMGKREPAAMLAGDHYRLLREELGKRSNVERVEILEHNPTRHGDPSMSYSARQDARKRTVRVRITQPLHASNLNVERWVEPRFILAAWSEYASARAAHLASVERSTASKSAAAAKRAADSAELESLIEAAGFKPNVSRFADPLGVNIRETAPHVADATATVTLTLAQFKTLLERVSS